MSLLNVNHLLRKKKFTSESMLQTNLCRALNLFDICALGISGTIGSGIYILGNRKKKLIIYMYLQLYQDLYNFILSIFVRKFMEMG